MKLVVVIPCLNEEETLPTVLSTIPKKIPNVDAVEILVVDDGCSDETVTVAREMGVHHFVRFKRTQGLAKAFQAGLGRALELGADIMVTTDGDNQYPSQQIPRLIGPVLRGEADMVIGDRQTSKIKHFSFVKKSLQAVGSLVVSWLSGAKVPDAVSGFRAYSRVAAMQVNVITRFSYATEVIIQAARRGLVIASVPIETNPRTRKSRLFGSTWEHVRQSAATILRVYVMYEALRVFVGVGSIVALLGFGLIGRFLILWILDPSSGSGHVQSLIVASVLLIVGFQIAVTGLIADQVSANRKLLDDILFRMRREELGDDRGEG